MAGSVAWASLRLTVRGSSGNVDLVVPLGADVAEVSREYAAALGQANAPQLSSTMGRALDPGQPVQQLGLQHGDVLVALDRSDAHATQRSAESGSELDGAAAPDSATSRKALCGVAAAFGLAAGGVGAFAGDGFERAVCVALLLLSAVIATVPTRAAPSSVSGARVAVAPAFAAAGAFGAVYTSAPGGLLLGLAVGGLAATIAAAVGRTGADSEHDDLLLAWLATAAVAATFAAAVLLLGAPERSYWALLFAVAVVVARVIPYLVVDVPDQVLLDLERLAITAWSARTRPRERRRRSVIKSDSAAGVVHRGHRLVSATAVAVAVAVAVCAPLLVLESAQGLAGTGARLLVLFGGGALALISRSYRAAMPRIALRVAGAWALGVLAVAFLLSSGSTTIAWAVAAMALVALVVVISALALGRGWRSLWWARTGDVAETLCIVFVVAALPVATGLFDFVRELTS